MREVYRGREAANKCSDANEAYGPEDDLPQFNPHVRPLPLAPNDTEFSGERKRDGMRRPVSPTQSENPLQRCCGLEAQKGDRP